jgi:hypothetical protein
MTLKVKITVDGDMGVVRVVGPFDHENAAQALLDARAVIEQHQLYAFIDPRSGVVRVPKHGPPRVEYTLRLE